MYNRAYSFNLLSNYIMNFKNFTIRSSFVYEFDNEIPPNSTFKIKVKIGNFEKYKPKESDFENII